MLTKVLARFRRTNRFHWSPAINNENTHDAAVLRPSSCL
ncbi:hypothetical protein PsAD2_02752 [Pseudovibrio axinellae]|uniref:Uncharacterized protein n=1 Tax=Pseudovibrio axinellae TaxID=989403 RepID=A0A165XTB5_9HYPH|nr:hypothetical protein PsAD2_02752 [Pseudovibrio axinellae]SER13334.1 hypothetical protein SAMN05421798_106228 [Pseudovibrio axinellae]